MKRWTTHSGYTIEQVLSGRSNVYLVTNGKQRILIDTSPDSKWNKLQSKLSKQGIESIDYLILTHTHYDHAANSRLLKLKYGCRLIVSKKEVRFVEEGVNKFPDGTNVFTRFMIRNIANRVSSRFNFSDCKADIVIDSVYRLEKLGFRGYILPTPGHSEGSISLIIDDEVAIVGDAMFGVFPWSVFPPFADDVKTMVASWGRLLETHCRIYLPGHGRANLRGKVEKSYGIWKKKVGG